MLQRTPLSSSASYPSSLDSVHGVRPSAQRAPRPAGVSAKRPSAGGMPLSDVGMGGGHVEDGTAWSMIARFVCSVPGCGVSFTKKQNLLRHQTQKHGRPKSHMRLSAKDYSDNADDDDDDDGTLPGFY